MSPWESLVCRSFACAAIENVCAMVRERPIHWWTITFPGIGTGVMLAESECIYLKRSMTALPIHGMMEIF